MAHLIFLLSALVLLVVFYLLTRYETAHSVRVWPSGRERLDAWTSRVERIVTHVDLAVFVRDELRHFVGRLGHDITHVSLVIVRAVERLLTRLVRHLRTHPEVDPAPRETAREFVKVLSEFKDNLKDTHPDLSKIE